jgi:P pilus assembly chaperone PapD
MYFDIRLRILVLLRMMAAALMVLLLQHPAAAQVTVAPTVLYIHQDNPMGTIVVTNRTQTAQEVAISLRFGYPDSDDEGQLIMNYDDEAAAQRYGLSEQQARIFPRQFTLEPGQRRSVRVQITDLRVRPDGVYWTRVNIVSNMPVPEVGTRSGLSLDTRVLYRIEQNIGIFFRKGDNDTAVELVSPLQVEVQDSLVHVIPRFRRTGNSPYIGSMRAELRDSDGTTVRYAERTFSVYFEQTRPLTIDAHGLPPGPYEVVLTTRTVRQDISAVDIVRAEPAIFVRRIRLGPEVP